MSTTMHPAQRAKMQKIAEDDANRVLQWEWDKVDKILTSAQVRQFIEEIREDFLQLISGPDESGLRQKIKTNGKEVENDRLRKKLIKTNFKKYNDFIKTNPSFFSEATKLPPFEPESDATKEEKEKYEEELDAFRKGQATVDFMLRMKESVENGQLTQLQASQLVHRATVKTFAKEKKE